MHLSRSLSLLAMAASFYAASPAYAGDREYKIEAAYIYNFLNYITWPDRASPHDLSQPVICLRGQEAIRPYLEYMSRKADDERHIVLRQLAASDTLKDCHIYYSGNAVNEEVIRDSIANGTLLIIHNEKRGDGLNGMIDLVESEGRIVMHINQSKLSASGFQVSSRLLSLAEKIE